jgi:hypothetical protein
MDRLAVAGIALALVIGVVGATRGRDAMAMRAQAGAAEAKVASARRDLERLRSIPADRRPPRSTIETLVLLDHGMLSPPTPLHVRALPEPDPRGRNPWVPLRGEPVTITIQTDLSPPAAVDWLELALENYTLLLTGIQWDGRNATIRAVVLGR